MLGTLRRDPVWLTIAVLSIGMLGIFLLWPLGTMLGKSINVLSLTAAPNHTGSPQPAPLRSTLHKLLPGFGFPKKVWTNDLPVLLIGRSESKIKNEPSGDTTGFWSYP